VNKEEAMNRQIAILASSQALIQTAAVLIMTVGGLLGLQLAPSKSLATAPIAAMFLGTAITMLPASLWMAKVGRRHGFIRGALIGLLGAVLATSGIYISSFTMLCAGTFLVGVYQGFAQFYRFAAIEMVEESHQTKAVSWVLAGGVVAAVLGPMLASIGSELSDVTFLGSFLFVTLAGLAAIALLSRLPSRPSVVLEATVKTARPLQQVIAQPAYLVALFTAASGYGLMTLTMTATPLAMSNHAHALGAISLVIQMHVLAMYLPSFLTGGLIKRFGSHRVMLAGACIFGCHFALASLGTNTHHFAVSLIFVDIGWNLLYIGGTALVTECVTPAEKGAALGLNDTIIFVVSLCCSLSAAGLVENFGWKMLNNLLIPWVSAIALGLIWLMRREHLRRRLNEPHERQDTVSPLR
jgi:MFS family permease